MPKLNTKHTIGLIRKFYPKVDDEPDFEKSMASFLKINPDKHAYLFDLLNYMIYLEKLPNHVKAPKERLHALVWLLGEVLE
jgi:hypothetical protein